MKFSAPRIRSMLTAMLFYSTLPAHVVAAPDLDSLRQLTKTIATEVMAGKVDTLIAHTHPAVIALVGGDEKARAVLPKMMRADFDAVEEMGFKMTKYEVGEPETVRSEADWTFVLLPTTLVAEGVKGKFIAKSHTLAAQKVGEPKWYLFRLGLPEPRVRKMLPELPADFTWPPKQRPKFEPR